MLVPVGALPFLFGGVTATEVLIAFGLLFVVGDFGGRLRPLGHEREVLESPAAAIIVTLLVALPALAGRRTAAAAWGCPMQPMSNGLGVPGWPARLAAYGLRPRRLRLGLISPS